ncbi:hypothetical protein [Hymenobacter algoricola]|uniref:Uncharacterized protein n=1 Tax=Hymenobacter algoricola TaxID=486267 RepID=A0ABP7NTU3_9BACT
MKKMPTAAGAAPGRRKPRPGTAGQLLLEHLGDEEGWAVLSGGQQLNPRILTAAALALYLSRNKLAARISNLDVLPVALQLVARRKPIH